MIPGELSPFANHVWQSTLFAAAAGLLTLLLRVNRAEVRYWIWLAASVKFLIPCSILVDAGGLMRHQTGFDCAIAIARARGCYSGRRQASR